MAEVSNQSETEESSEKQQVSEPKARQDLTELDNILEELSALIVLCEETLQTCAELKHQEAVQRQLKTYASGLIGVAKCLQHLHDFRRLIPAIIERAQTARTSLIAVRGGEEDALVSEEARVIAAVEQTKETVMQSIQSLESVLSHVRQSSPPLLATISFTSPGFTQFASQALSAVRVDFVVNTAFTERERLRSLRQDIHDVYVLLDHASSLQ